MILQRQGALFACVRSPLNTLHWIHTCPLCVRLLLFFFGCQYLLRFRSTFNYSALNPHLLPLCLTPVPMDSSSSITFPPQLFTQLLSFVLCPGKIKCQLFSWKTIKHLRKMRVFWPISSWSSCTVRRFFSLPGTCNKKTHFGSFGKAWEAHWKS